MKPSRLPILSFFVLFAANVNAADFSYVPEPEKKDFSYAVKPDPKKAPLTWSEPTDSASDELVSRLGKNCGQSGCFHIEKLNDSLLNGPVKKTDKLRQRDDFSVDRTEPANGPLQFGYTWQLGD